MSELHDLTALEQGDAVRRGEVSPRELAAHYLDRADEVGAFVTRTPERRPRRGPSRCCRCPTDAGPAVRRTDRDQGPEPDRRGADDVRLGGVRRLRARRLRRRSRCRSRRAGMVSLGKTNTPEFGSPCYTEPDVAPPAVTPWDRDPDGRRLVGRCRGRGRRGAGAGRPGLRRRRLDPDPGLVLRARRAEADARPDQRLADVRRGHRARDRRDAGRARSATRRPCSTCWPAGGSATRPGLRRRRRRSCRPATASRGGCGSRASSSR